MTEFECRRNSQVPKFEELSRKVMKKIRKLGGHCFPKLDWSSPKDAAWIGLNRTLSCSTFIDICLLLKSSSLTTHDLAEPFEYCHPVNAGRLLYQLVKVSRPQSVWL